MSETKRGTDGRRITIIAVTALILSIIAVTMAAYPLVVRSPQPAPSAYLLSVSAQPVEECLSNKPFGWFSTIANKNGFNDSVSYPSKSNFQSHYPVIEVSQGSAVHILFCDLSPYETMGMAIEYYLQGGAFLPPNTATLVVFVAAQSGSFRIYDPVLSTVHLYVDNGLLIVKPT